MSSKKIFVNLPVKDLERSMALFTALGFTLNPQFSNDLAACMVWSEDIYAMLLTHQHFAPFTPKPIADATRGTEVIVALSLESREEVTRLVEAAIANGGKRYADPKDHGFMFQWGFEDLDGHIWELFWMDPNAAPPQR